MQTELSYDEAAQVLECSPRHVRNLLEKYSDICPKIQRSYKHVRFNLSDLLKVKEAIRRAAIERKVAA